MCTKRKLVHGWGVNDSPTKVYWFNEDGLKQTCPYYQRWVGMVRRVHSEKYLKSKPSYEGATICDEWKYFTNFKKWMQGKNWNGFHLDKEILGKFSKHYSPENCAFISQALNTFTTSSLAKRGELPIGVFNMKGRYGAYCDNPFLGKRQNLGGFNCPVKAHLAWRKKKHELAVKYAEEGFGEHFLDRRLSQALQELYLPLDEVWDK